MSEEPSFFAELKRRNVYKVAVAYAVVGWLVIQISSTVLPTFHAPEWAVQTLVVLVAIGFPIALVIAWAFEITPQGIERTEVADTMPTAAGQKKHAWIYIVVIGAAISVGLFFVGRYTANTAPRQDAGAARTEAPTTILQKSIAVLQFENLSDDKGAAYFADGIQDEILTKLASIADLKVISRTSTAKYKSKPEDLKSKAADLLPPEKDALDGNILQAGLAELEVRTGAASDAIAILRRLLTIPAGEAVSIARLKIDPVWDPIRNDPGFQQVLAGTEHIGP
jgi:hypothetical protein